MPARDGLARVYAMQGRYDEAVRELEAALEIDPEYEPAQRRLKILRDPLSGR